jgi:hypothetical protein
MIDQRQEARPFVDWLTYISEESAKRRMTASLAGRAQEVKKCSSDECNNRVPAHQLWDICDYCFQRMIQESVFTA